MRRTADSKPEPGCGDPPPPAIAFVGCVIPDEMGQDNPAFSRAGNMFQLNLIRGMCSQHLCPDAIVSFRPERAYPRSRTLFVRGGRTTLGADLTATLLPYLNITPFKQLTLGLGTLVALLRFSAQHRHRKRVYYAFNLTVPPGILTYLAARLTRSQMVASLNDINVPGQTLPSTWLSRLDYRLQQWLIPRLDGHVAVTDAIMRDFAPGRTYLRIEGGVTEEVFARTRPWAPEDAKRRRAFTAVAAGSLDEANGISLILDAMSQLQDQDVRLVIVGSGPLRFRVEAAAAADHRIDYRGLLRFDEVLALYNEADVLLNVRLTRAVDTRYFFPSKLMEYLATGRPVISTLTGHVESEYSAFCFLLRQETPDGLARLLKEVMASTIDERIERGRLARHHMLTEKTWDARARRLASYMAEVVGGARGQCHDSGPARTRVLVLTPYYLPGHLAGGPIRSLANLVTSLGHEFEFMVVTSDRDLGSPRPYPGIVAGLWSEVGKARVMYLRPGLQAVVRLCGVLRASDYDLLYLNSFFARPWSMLPVLWRRLGFLSNRPVLLAPRGEFSTGALAIKRRRKRLFLRLTRALRLHDQVTWHASSPFEAEDIRREMGASSRIKMSAPLMESASRPTTASAVTGLRIRVAEDLPSAPGIMSRNVTRPSKLPGHLRMVFLARVARMKNLDFALRVLQGCSGQIQFDVYGPREDERYWRECAELALRCPPTIRVEFKGALAHDLVHEVLAGYHLLFFPTRGENFGHAISEALCAGCPVLISDRTPWRGLEAHGVGWDLPLEWPEEFVNRIELCVAMDEHEFAEMAGRTAVLGEARRTSPHAVAQSRALLLEACRRG